MFRARRPSRLLLDAVYDSCPDGILVIDEKGRVVSRNETFVRLMGEGFLARLQEIPEQPETDGYDELELPDGRIIERYTSRVRGKNGRSLGRVWYFRDVSERHRAEQERRTQEARYRELFEAGSDAVLLVDLASGSIEDANRAAVQLFGYTKEELLTMPASGLHDKPAASVRAIGGLLDGSKAWPEPERHVLRRRDGSSFPAEIAVGLYASGGNEKLLAAIRDLTERERAAQADKFREREQLQRQLVATVSHELRTPIAAIQGFAETLLGGALDDGAHRREFVDTILRHAGRLSRLVDDLLTLSVFEQGRQKLHLETIDAHRFVWDFIGGMEPVARRRNARLRALVDSDLRAVADPTRLTQVLQNLVDNALKYGRPKGACVTISAAVDGRFARFTVADDGPGIPANEVERVFEPFHRLDGRRVPGAGLGLAIVRQVVLGHGGRVWAESRPGEGGRFHFTIPLLRATSPKRRAPTLALR